VSLPRPRSTRRPLRVRPARAPLAALLALGAALPAAAGAQVGYDPVRSPFQDLEYRQSLSVVGGYFRTGKDRVGVAPQGGPLVGVQYDAYIGGPASFTARLATVSSERSVIDPARDAGNRVIGTEQRPLTLLDVGFTFALTGAKSYRGFVPLTHAGVGVASNFRGPDVGGYRFGTAFALAYGVGGRWVPTGRRISLRGDLGWRLYQVRFPDSYFRTGLDGTSVLPAADPKSGWQNNLAITLGASYQFRR
jgi:hypothetical protein